MILQVYPTHGVYTAQFGENYSKFFEAFQQGLSTPQVPQLTTNILPAKRSAAASKQASKRRRRDEHAFLPQSDHHQALQVPDHPSATARTKAAAKTKPIEITTPSNIARESRVTSSPRPSSEAKGKSPGMNIILRDRLYFFHNFQGYANRMLLLTESSSTEQPSRRKGVGIYAGNWEYVTDEEKVPEYLSLAQETADFQGRTTRRAYAKLTSREEAGDSSRLIDLSSRNRVRKSGRARSSVDYTRLSGPEDSDREAATPQEVEGDASPAPKQTSPSTSDSSPSMPDPPNRSISSSTTVNTAQPERPKLSWNAIVYEVLATSETFLTFPQLVLSVKDRYPYFKSSSQDKLLESGVKNPLYFHEAFCKGEIINGKQTWGLKPGEFIDKKTGQVLTPQPRCTITFPKPTKQTHGKEVHNPVALTPKSAQPSNPRASNPRFGRDILNSPEIPDSQDAKATTSSPPEADSRTGTEYALPPEQPYQRTSPTASHRAHQHADAADANSTFSSQASQKRYDWMSTTVSPTKTAPTREPPGPAGTKIQSIQNLLGTIDYEAPATAAQPLTALKAAQPPTSSSPSSTRENRQSSGSTNSQAASASAPLVQIVSPTGVPDLLEDGATKSRTPSITSAVPTPSVTSLAYTQMYVVLSSLFSSWHRFLAKRTD